MSSKTPNPERPASVTDNPWRRLREYTDARIGLGRAGGSLPTAAQLEFQLAHAQARDAVHLALDTERMVTKLSEHFDLVLRLHSAAHERSEYLRRPDLGRRLDEASARQLSELNTPPCDVALCVVDGLSSRAIHENALPFLDALLPLIEEEGWLTGPLALVEQGRVAIGDPIGEALNARMGVVLIGERPGLSSPDSLGIYFTWAPCTGRRDSERNCISNVRPRGQSYDAAARLLVYLMREASTLGVSGVALKDNSEAESQLGGGGGIQGNFLLPR
ncbi:MULTISPECIES: ethanolamine ammonia-lyase subunit EutC [Halomonadaceae]|uniref:ethanolamine ammonia-lyase subunit EutC n=1 Tax=Halomonadaceae TaxID=28256 RepID=UPI00159AF879|nr:MULTISPECIES: ethanolamine ammonia-lyase subunit EutC [Halomonas]QJQ94315.1 ethanolamine ammonia-lyase subunit EutC [Halomonas sp. PA5]